MLAVLAEALGCHSRELSVARGHTSHDKVVSYVPEKGSVSAEEVHKRLVQAANS